jgi:hypothetical protein
LNSSSLPLEKLGLLPGEVLVGEVAVLGSLEVDGLGKVQLAHNDTRTEVKVVLDDLDELVRGLAGGAVCLDEDGEGLSDTDGVRQLDEGAASKLGVDEGLGNPASDVSGRAVDLGVVLSGESTTTVSTPTTLNKLAREKQKEK